MSKAEHTPRPLVRLRDSLDRNEPHVVRALRLAEEHSIADAATSMFENWSRLIEDAEQERSALIQACKAAVNCDHTHTPEVAEMLQQALLKATGHITGATGETP